MKETLRQRMEQLLKRLQNRKDILDRHIKEYVESGNLADAAINQIKSDTISLVINQLIAELK